jgi:hypothetical protein
MLKVFLSVCLVLVTPTAFAAWKVEQGKKALTISPPTVGTIATVPAKSASKGYNARLQLDCFVSPDLSGLSFNLILSKEPPKGFIARRYQYDDGAPVQTKPFSRALPPENINLGDRSAPEVKALMTAKRLRLTLLPADGSEIPFEFDVSGASDAASKLACKEFNRMR